MVLSSHYVFVERERALTTMFWEYLIFMRRAIEAPGRQTGVMHPSSILSDSQHCKQHGQKKEAKPATKEIVYVRIVLARIK